MREIADWLEKLGMSEYAQRFAENRIDFTVLRDLTDQDLKDIGVVARRSPENFARDRRAGQRRGHHGAGTGSRDRSPYGCRPPTATTATSSDRGRSRRRAPLSDGDVLRSGGLDRHFRAARCRGVARPRRRLSRCRFGRGDGNGRPCCEETWRRADVAVRLSGRA